MPAQRWPDVSPEVAGQIEAALSAGKKIEAIKIYSDATGAGLKEAKDAIEGTVPASIRRPTGGGSIWPGVSAEAALKIDAALAVGDRIGAIRMYREATRCSLVDATEAIERGLPANFVDRTKPIPLRALITFALVIIIIFAIAFFRKQ
jgi:ribosomal protein L7/L12